MSNDIKVIVESIRNLRIRYDNINTVLSMKQYHEHEEYELSYLLSGEREHLVNDKIHYARPGEITLISNNVPHRTIKTSPGKYERMCIYFNSKFLDSFNSNIGSSDLFSCFRREITILRLNQQQQEFMNNLICKILHESTLKSEKCKAYIEVLMLELLIFVNRCAEDETLHVTDEPESRYKKVSDILSYINANYMEDITLTMLSKKFFISQSSIIRNFKHATGCTLINYLNRYRIKQAQLMLQQTDASISEISQRVGYNSITHFGRIFKEITGCSALEYRKKMKVNS